MMHLRFSVFSLFFFLAVIFSIQTKAQTEESDLDQIEAEIKKSEDKIEVQPRVQETQKQNIEDVEVKQLSDLTKLTSFEDVAVLQRRLMPKTGRFQFFGGIPYWANSPWFNGIGLEGRVGYNFTEAIGVEGLVNFMSVSEGQALTNLWNEHRVSSGNFVRGKTLMGFNLTYTPMYGKLTVYDKRIIPFDFYFSAGMSSMSLEQSVDSSAQAMQFGLGQIFALDKRSAFRWDLSMYLYNARVDRAIAGSVPPARSISTDSLNTLLLTLGYSIYYPEAKR